MSAVERLKDARVLLDAERLTATEVKIRADLDAGATLAQVLEKYGHV